MHILDGLFVIIFVFIMVQLSFNSNTNKKPQKENSQTSKIFNFNFINHPSVRDFYDEKLGVNLSDIESHLPVNHAYKDKDLITWGHESTHGINANVRNAHPEAWKVNGFYCLRNRAAILYEPKTTITKVAARVPQVLRGPSYDLYLRQQTAHWNLRPLYLVDEWIAYTNGVEVGLEMDAAGWDYELLQAHNFNVYVICLAMEIQSTCPEYDDTAFFDFIKWNIERVANLTARAASKSEQGVSRSKTYLSKIRTEKDAAKFREFCKAYFGIDWCETNLGF